MIILYGGTIGEDGIENIRYGEDGEGKIFEKIQKYLKKLKTMGFMLSICSKITLKMFGMHLS